MDNLFKKKKSIRLTNLSPRESIRSGKLIVEGTDLSPQAKKERGENSALRQRRNPEFQCGATLKGVRKEKGSQKKVGWGARDRNSNKANIYY